MRLPWLLLTAPVVSAMWPESWLIGETCYNCATFGFDNCNAQDIQCLCSSENFLASVALCIKDHTHNAKNRYTAWEHFAFSVCSIHNAEVSDKNFLKAEEYLRHHQDDDITEAGDIPNPHDYTHAPESFGTPVKISEENYRRAYRSVQNYLRQKDISVVQGSFLVWWWLVAVIMAMVNKAVMHLSVRFSSSRAAMARPNRLSLLWQQYVGLPACLGYKHICKIPFLGMNYMIPTRHETLLIAGYFLLNVVFMVTPYDFLSDDIMYPTHYKEMMRFVSDRSGIIGVVQMPLMVLFALRNNLLITLTGWNYATFNTYHRAIARVVYAQFIVHAVTKHVFSASYGSSLALYFYPVPYYRWGVAGMFLFAIMIFSGWYRANHYEVFLRLHILGAAGGFVCTLYHLNGLGYQQPVYVAFGLWGLDWLIRLARLAFLNFNLLLSPVEGSKRYTVANLYLVNGDVINVRVHLPIRWIVKPGQYCYLTVNRLRFWENHPFSVVGGSREGDSLQLCIKARGGMTRSLLKHLETLNCDETSPIRRSVLIEGPYGVHCPVERYDACMVVAGGIGITGVVPYLEHLIDMPHSTTPYVLFIWTVSSRADVSWLEDRIGSIAASGKVRMHIFASMTIRSASIGSSLSEKSSASFSPKSSKEPYTIRSRRQSSVVRAAQTRASPLIAPTASSLASPISTGGSSWQECLVEGIRPDLKIMVREFLSHASGSACVLGCGPPPLMDDLRSSVANHLHLVDNGRADYFEEAYSW